MILNMIIHCKLLVKHNNIVYNVFGYKWPMVVPTGSNVEARAWPSLAHKPQTLSKLA